MRKRILWIEDDYYAIRGLVRPLEKLGFSIESAISVSEAVEKLMDWQKYDLIIADIILPLFNDNSKQIPEFIFDWKKNLDESSNYEGANLIKWAREKIGITTPFLVLSLISNPLSVLNLQNITNIYTVQKAGLLPSHFEAKVIEVLKEFYEGDVEEMLLSQFGHLSINTEKILKSQNNNQKINIFLCHSSTDKLKVKKLFQKLISDGFNPWLDEENLLPGQDWAVEIPRAVRNSHVVVVCLSKVAITKEGYIQKEIRIALDVADEKPDDVIFIIPAKLEECEVPDRLRRWQWVNLFRENGYAKLRNVLKLREKDLLEKT